VIAPVDLNDRPRCGGVRARRTAAAAHRAPRSLDRGRSCLQLAAEQFVLPLRSGFPTTLARRLVGGSLAALAWVALASQAWAGEPAPGSSPACNDPRAISGIVRPAQQPADPPRAVANALLFVPRQLAELVFLTTGTAAGLIENEQVVPRVRELLFSHDGQIGVFPTLFLETGSNANVGGRMIASAQNMATTLRAGYGGADANVVESRMRFARVGPLPAVLSIEGLHDRRTDLAYAGVGQTPESDPRNRFVSDMRQAAYRERRERAIVSVGVRPASDLELFVSSSYTQRFADDLPDSPARFDQVFEPSSVAGVSRTTRLVYTELALRVDTREVRAAPVPGLLLEGYAGTCRGVLDESADFLRLGGRAAGFFSVYRRTNILSPRVIVDGVANPSGRAVPFQELAHQPEFRGFDTHRDNVSAIVSVDYRWKFASFIASYLFFDAAAVGPTLRDMDFSHFRWATGTGLDLYASNAQLGRLGVAFSPQGVLFLLSFGVSPRFGDRQHRD
jgi:hypothetical protein